MSLVKDVKQEVKELDLSARVLRRGSATLGLACFAVGILIHHCASGFWGISDAGCVFGTVKNNRYLQSVDDHCPDFGVVRIQNSFYGDFLFGYYPRWLCCKTVPKRIFRPQLQQKTGFILGSKNRSPG